MMRPIFTALPMGLLWLAGCGGVAELPYGDAGNRAHGRAASADGAAGGAPRGPAMALYFRGAAELESAGIYDVAARLRTRGVLAGAYPSLAQADKDELAAWPGPVIIGGVSLGCRTATELAAAVRRPVAELTLIDPTPVPPLIVPANVRHVTLVRNWATDVRAADPKTEIQTLDVGNPVPVIGWLWNWTFGHLAVTDDQRTRDAAVDSAVRAAGAECATIGR